ncbi:MAG: hypothetical protein AAFQ62_15695 [Pseudomonadota bacterium]
MQYDVVPTTYEQWRHCITVECGIPLTPEYIAQRLSVWKDENTQETTRFRGLYGDAHWRAVTSWFERAQKELA